MAIKKIAICCDSKGALLALNKEHIKSKAVSECYQQLTQASEICELELLWIPGPKGFDGNENADKLAKIGAAEEHIDYQCNLATNVIKTAKKEWLQKAFERYWENAPRMKHSKALLVYPDKYRTKKLLKMNKSRIRIWTMFLTGHGIFKKHLRTMGLISEANCRFCKENV